MSQGAALTIGAVLGTGVISLPALAVQAAGPASLLAWVALLLLSVPLATTFAALGARYPDGGGVSTYARRAFGARAATVVGWCFYFAIPIGAPTAAGFAAAYVADSAGGGRPTRLVATGAIILLVAAMNWFGLTVSPAGSSSSSRPSSPSCCSARPWSRCRTPTPATSRRSPRTAGSPSAPRPRSSSGRSPAGRR